MKRNPARQSESITAMLSSLCWGLLVVDVPGCWSLIVRISCVRSRQNRHLHRRRAFQIFFDDFCKMNGELLWSWKIKISPHVTIVVESFVYEFLVTCIVEELNVRWLHLPSVHREAVHRPQTTDRIWFQPDSRSWSLMLRFFHVIQSIRAGFCMCTTDEDTVSHQKGERCKHWQRNVSHFAVNCSWYPNELSRTDEIYAFEWSFYTQTRWLRGKHYRQGD